MQGNEALTAPPAIDQAKEIALPAMKLAKFVGRYEISTQFALEISQHDDTLFVQATGQQILPVFATSPTTFFYKAVKAELSFRVDSTGAVTGLVLRQNGAEQPARRVR